MASHSPPREQLQQGHRSRHVLGLRLRRSTCNARCVINDAKQRVAEAVVANGANLTDRIFQLEKLVLEEKTRAPRRGNGSGKTGNESLNRRATRATVHSRGRFSDDLAESLQVGELFSLTHRKLWTGLGMKQKQCG